MQSQSEHLSHLLTRSLVAQWDKLWVDEMSNYVHQTPLWQASSHLILNLVVEQIYNGKLGKSPETLGKTQVFHRLLYLHDNTVSLPLSTHLGMSKAITCECIHTHMRAHTQTQVIYFLY